MKRRNIIKYLLFVIFIINTAFSCEKYNFGHFEEEVVNFSQVNTIYDDYNSNSPVINYDFLFHFSSNRNSYGNDFDIVGEDMYIRLNKEGGTLDIGKHSYTYLHPFFDSINTSCNELGPYSLTYYPKLNSGDTISDLILYANDCNGNYDIKFASGYFYTTSGYYYEKINAVDEISFLNTDANELYPSFYGKEFYYHSWNRETDKIEKIIYCSDKDGQYDIFEAAISVESSLIKTLESDESLEPVKLELSSSFDDKCPSVNGNVIVFASNRVGGYGGYDLYYSVIENDRWSDPINFGDKINSSYDEYRPITLDVWDYDNNLLIFSSDRPDGKGGFDLYYTGIEKLIQ